MPLTINHISTGTIPTPSFPLHYAAHHQPHIHWHDPYTQLPTTLRRSPFSMLTLRYRRDPLSAFVKSSFSLSEAEVAVGEEQNDTRTHEICPQWLVMLGWVELLLWMWTVTCIYMHGGRYQNSTNLQIKKVWSSSMDPFRALQIMM